jgi:hypothetical protein
MNIFENTMSEGLNEYTVAITAATTTAITISCYVTLQTKLNHIVANYILIHEAIWTNNLIYGI